MFNFDEHPELYYWVLAGGILLGAILVAQTTRYFLSRYIDKASEVLKVDVTRYRFLKNALALIIYLVAVLLIFYFIPSLHSLGLTLLASAGVFAAILGFASQHAFANIISGIFIVIFKPFRVGDLINIGDRHMGWVEDITLRHTVIRNFEHRYIIFPNSQISSETIVNSSILDLRICNFIDFSISYSSDIDKAMLLIQEEANRHPLCIDARLGKDRKEGRPKVEVKVIKLGNYSVDLRAFAWSADHPSGYQLKTDLLKTVKERFDKEDIEIPYPYQNLILRNKPGESSNAS